MKPEWLKVKSYASENRENVEKLLARLSLHTVCEEASCPNLMECFSRKTATFMILGRVCTRNCTFCDVVRGCPSLVEIDEPQRVAEACKELGLKHVVITSVTRDDLPDGGASHFAQTIRSIREFCPGLYIEVLIPDFQGDRNSLDVVLQAKPDILNHNLETIERLYPEVRSMANYNRSLGLLENVKKSTDTVFTKSGIMVGLGEKQEEVLKLLQDLRDVGCDFLTIGQYLSPSKKHHPVVEYVHPDVFEFYRAKAMEVGFKHVASAPLVRSSYQADKALSIL